MKSLRQEQGGCRIHGALVLVPEICSMLAVYAGLAVLRGCVLSAA